MCVMINNTITRHDAYFKASQSRTYYMYLATCCVGGKCIYHPQCSGCDNGRLFGYYYKYIKYRTEL